MQHARRYFIDHFVNRHQGICAATDQLAAIRAPVNIYGGRYVPLDNTCALPVQSVPHTQCSILTPTEQAGTIWSEGQTDNHGGMSMTAPMIFLALLCPKATTFYQHYSSPAGFHLDSRPHGLPGRYARSAFHAARHSLRSTVSPCHPSLRWQASCHREQSPSHPPRPCDPEVCDTDCGPGFLNFPQTNRPFYVAARQQASIWAPRNAGYRVGMKQFLNLRAALNVPDSDGCITSSTRNHATIGANATLLT